jgi:antitoxin component of RelBE/YafQ-DinJ toxin-antitoxin module
MKESSLSIRVSIEEKELFSSKASECGLKLSEWVRSVLTKECEEWKDPFTGAPNKSGGAKVNNPYKPYEEEIIYR